MKFYDCAKYLLKGCKVRRSDWPQNKYIYLQNNDGVSHFMIHNEDDTEIEWSHIHNKPNSKWEIIKDKNC